MKTSDMIFKLMQIRDTHGNLPIVGGCLSDDIPPQKIIVIDEDGCDICDSNREAIGVFIT